MRALVTGVAGFIGSHVAERLLARGDEVLGLDNFDPGYARSLKEANLRGLRASPAFRLVEADLRDAACIEALMARYPPQAILHLAAKAGVRASMRQPEACVENNVQGTLNLLRACRRCPIGHFVLASSSSVYGDSAQVPFEETAPTQHPASPYAASKIACEALGAAYHQLLGMPVTCLRFFSVYGPRQRPDLAIHRFTRRIAAGQPVPVYGDGSARRDYTYIADIVAGVEAALDRPEGFAVYNLGRGAPLSLLEVLQALETALGRRACLDRQTAQPGDVSVTHAAIGKARARLGYAPRIPFEEGIRRFVAWWQAATVPDA